MNESKELLTTTQKARTINFDVPLYGTFAEIGAGQEVAREFFHAGGASGTIAKSISAYDMVFSDAIYGKAPRYVSRERLNLMLDHEYELLIARLSGGDLREVYRRLQRDRHVSPIVRVERPHQRKKCEDRRPSFKPLRAPSRESLHRKHRRMRHEHSQHILAGCAQED
jgi:hypothetical protein